MFLIGCVLSESYQDWQVHGSTYTFFLAPNPISVWKCLSVGGDCHCGECFKSQSEFERSQLLDFFFNLLGQGNKMEGGEPQGWVGIVQVQFFLLCDSHGVYLRGTWWCCSCLLGQGGGGWWQGLTSPFELPPKEGKAVAPQ